MSNRLKFECETVHEIDENDVGRKAVHETYEGDVLRSLRCWRG